MNDRSDDDDLDEDNEEEAVFVDAIPGLEPDDYELLGSTRIIPRVFNRLNGDSILGLMLLEVDDSFLVGLPSRLSKITKEEESKYEVIPFLPVKTFRFFKTDISSVCPLFGIFESEYNRYLQTVAKPVYPELISSVNFTDSDPYVYTVNSILDPEAEAVQLDEVGRVEELKPGYTKLGLSDEELEKRLSEMYRGHGLFINDSTTKH